MLYREPKLLKGDGKRRARLPDLVSVLYREPKLLKVVTGAEAYAALEVSVLYREPKLLKGALGVQRALAPTRFQCSTVSRNC